MFSKYFYPHLQHEFWYPKSNQKCTRIYSHIDKNTQSDKDSCYEQNTEILHNGMPKSRTRYTLNQIRFIRLTPFRKNAKQRKCSVKRNKKSKSNGTEKKAKNRNVKYTHTHTYIHTCQITYNIITLKRKMTLPNYLPTTINTQKRIIRYLFLQVSLLLQHWQY